MKKADNFDASKWLVENKITFQSRLNENEEFSGDFPSLDYNTITNFIKSKGYKITSDYYDSGFDVNDGEYFVGVFDDHIAITGDNGQVKDIPFNESRLNEAEPIVDFKKWKSTLMPFYEEVIKEINQPDMSLNIYSRWVGDFIKYCNTYTSYDNLIKYGFYVQDIKTDEDLKDQLVKFIKYHI